MPRNGEGVPVSLITDHGRVLRDGAKPATPSAHVDPKFTTNERLAYRALTQIRMALGMSVHDTPDMLAEAVTELVQRNGAPSRHSVLVDVGGTEYAVTHQVAAELARLRDGLRGSVVLVQVALDLRDEAVDLLSIALDANEATGALQGEFNVMARSVVEARAKARAAAGEG